MARETGRSEHDEARVSAPETRSEHFKSAVEELPSTFALDSKVGWIGSAEETISSLAEQNTDRWAKLDALKPFADMDASSLSDEQVADARTALQEARGTIHHSHHAAYGERIAPPGALESYDKDTEAIEGAMQGYAKKLEALSSKLESVAENPELTDEEKEALTATITDRITKAEEHKAAAESRITQRLADREARKDTLIKTTEAFFAIERQLYTLTEKMKERLDGIE